MSASAEKSLPKIGELAEASGVIVVGVFSIEEVSSPEAAPVMFDTAESAPAARAGGAVPVSPGQASVTVRVHVVYEIDQPLG